MQKLGRSLARLGPARALLAGAAMMVSAAAPISGESGAQTSEDTAMAIPRVSAPGGDTRVALPQPLAPSEARRIRRIFELQAKNDIPAAIAESEQLADSTLLPDILADRYLRGPDRANPRATPEELASWLANYSDLPDATAVHTLLIGLAPNQAAQTAVPAAMPTLPAPPNAGDDVEATERLIPRNPTLDHGVHDAARSNADRAIRLIARTRGIDRIYGAQLRAEVAQILFTEGRDAEALSIAKAAHKQAGGEVGLAPFIAGLAAWRLDRRDLAERMFQAAFNAKLSQPGQRAGAAFWAARAVREREGPATDRAWLRRAAENSRTFYGLLARRILGRSISPDPDIDRLTLGEADVDAVDSLPAGRRAFALLQVGQDARAANELQLLWSQTRDKPGFAQSIMLVAKAAGLKTLADQFAALLYTTPVRLPERRLDPAGGFRTNPALIYAIARLESNFDPKAVSPAGARGLMQLMPSTAEHILGRRASKLHDPKLHDPAVSLDLGQRYLLMLAQYDVIGGDLIRLLAGYNSGPGSLARWVGSIQYNGDPLLFIESVPTEETRNYIPRVLAYAWLYAAKLNLPSPSLDELAAGAWPRFHPGVPNQKPKDAPRDPPKDAPAVAMVADLQ